MTEYKNRAERRRFQRVEMRKIRTEYKQQMKAFSCLDYNEKKFNKTVFYRSLEQVSQINAVIDTPATGTNKEEGPSSQTNTPMQVSDISEETREESVAADTLGSEDATGKEEYDATEAPSSETGTIMTEYQNRAARRGIKRAELRKIRTEYKRKMKAFRCLDYNAKKFGKTVFYCNWKQASVKAAEDASFDCNSQDTTTETYISGESSSDIFTSSQTDTTVNCTRQEEGPSPPADTAMAFYNYECAPEDNRIRGVYDRTDQAVEGIVYEEEYIQDNMLVIPDDFGHATGNIEQVTEEGILVAEMSKVEDSFIQPDATTRPLTADIEIVTARNIDCSQEVVYSSDDTSVEDKDYAPFTSVQASGVSEAREARKESVIEDTLGSKDVNISAGKEECDVKEAPSFEAGTFTIMADQEDEAGIVVKEVGITLVVNSFKLRWNLLPVISLHMFDCSLNTPCEIQAFVNVLGNAAGGENTEVGEDKKDTEELLCENEDDVQKDDEAGQQQEKDERALEVAWMVASPCSIMRVICEDKTSLLVTPPQSITGFVFNRTLSVQPSITSRVKESEAVTAFREVTFSPVEGVKRKRLRNLKTHISWNYKLNIDIDSLGSN
ncbi:hypothetical protein EDC94DRAFT_673698 [Helicostylum pulchrum]|nr:hypothetical protein EDC94DRAFT_673698 [Helicostylum pulchrum]